MLDEMLPDIQPIFLTLVSVWADPLLKLQVSQYEPNALFFFFITASLMVQVTTGMSP